MRTASTIIRVRFGDTDAAGLVFYPSFYVWFDAGTKTVLRGMDGVVRDPDGRPRWYLPIVESGASFHSPVYDDDEITVISTAARVGTSSLRMEHEVRRGELVCARGWEQRVHVAPMGGRLAPLPLPDDLATYLRA